MNIGQGRNGALRNSKGKRDSSVGEVFKKKKGGGGGVGGDNQTKEYIISMYAVVVANELSLAPQQVKPTSLITPDRTNKLNEPRERGVYFLQTGGFSTE